MVRKEIEQNMFLNREETEILVKTEVKDDGKNCNTGKK